MLLMVLGPEQRGFVGPGQLHARGLELLQLVAQGARADPEPLGRQLAAARGLRQGLEDQFAFALAQIVAEAAVGRGAGAFG
ncbi:MAG: hypothetical protein WB440_15470, partial [Steroidobacteraceae bacterium]